MALADKIRRCARIKMQRTDKLISQPLNKCDRALPYVYICAHPRKIYTKPHRFGYYIYIYICGRRVCPTSTRKHIIRDVPQHIYQIVFACMVVSVCSTWQIIIRPRCVCVNVFIVGRLGRSSVCVYVCGVCKLCG